MLSLIGVKGEENDFFYPNGLKIRKFYRFSLNFKPNYAMHILDNWIMLSATNTSTVYPFNTFYLYGDFLSKHGQKMLQKPADHFVSAPSYSSFTK